MNYGLNPRHLLQYAIEPARQALGFNRFALERNALVLGTALAESELTSLVQNNGPALGLWQCEPATHQDLQRNYIGYRLHLKQAIAALGYPVTWEELVPDAALITDLRYAAAICHIHYYRVSQALPRLDPVLFANYWKTHYNTVQGKGRAKNHVGTFRFAIQEVMR